MTLSVHAQTALTMTYMHACAHAYVHAHEKMDMHVCVSDETRGSKRDRWREKHEYVKMYMYNASLLVD